MNVGEKIKELRRKKRLTMKELGKKVKLSEQAIGNYERGDRTPNIDTIQAIATALKVPVSELIGEKQKTCDFCTKHEELTKDDGSIRIDEYNNLEVSTMGCYVDFNINFCPMCGRKLGD